MHLWPIWLILRSSLWCLLPLHFKMLAQLTRPANSCTRFQQHHQDKLRSLGLLVLPCWSNCCKCKSSPHSHPQPEKAHIVSCSNGVISFRVYDLIIKVAAYSDSTFDACESSGLLSVFIKELQSDDLLVKINAIELLNEVRVWAKSSICHHSFIFYWHKQLGI